MPKTTKQDTTIILDECRRDLDQMRLNIDHEKQTYEKNSRYHRVSIGLILIAARDLYKIPNDGSRGNQHKASAVTAQASEDRPESFEHFLETINWLPRRTAYAYIKAAENLDLAKQSKTPAKRAAAMQQLRKSRALHKLSANEWTALCGAGTKPKDDPAPVEVDAKNQGVFTFYQQSITELKQTGSTILEIKSSLDPQRYATVAALLQKQLEQLTGQNWEPNTEEHDPKHYKELWPEADPEHL